MELRGTRKMDVFTHRKISNIAAQADQILIDANHVMLDFAQTFLSSEKNSFETGQLLKIFKKKKFKNLSLYNHIY